jgi:hypothetical protein
LAAFANAFLEGDENDSLFVGGPNAAAEPDGQCA